MPQVKFVDGNQVFGSHRIFLDVKQTGAPKIDNAEAFYTPHHLAYAIVLWAGAVIDQIAQLNIIRRTPVKGIDNRQPVETV